MSRNFSWIFVLFSIVLIVISTPVYASCLKQKILYLDSKGLSAEEISDKCDMSIKKVKQVLNNDQDEPTGGREPIDPSPVPKTTPPPIQYGSTCCDVYYGISRCMLSAPNPIGASCFCLGQGAGVTCR